MEEDKDCATVEKQEVKPTAKSMEDTLQRKIRSRRANLSQLTAKTIQMLHLMDDNGNLEVVKTKLAVKFHLIFGEFRELNVSVKWLFQQIVSEKDMSNDQQHWFEPKANSFREFNHQENVWMNEVQGRMEEARKVNESVHPSDSVSVTASRKSRKSNLSCTCSQAAGLKQKYALEEKEDNLKAEN